MNGDFSRLIARHAAPHHQPARRRLLAGLGGAMLAMPLARAFADDAPAPAAAKPVTIEMFDDGGRALGEKTLPLLVKSDSGWRALLTPDQFAITRQAGTEKPYSGQYWNNHGDGLYRCVCCATALFDSRTKYDSRTGWPSFYQAISRDNVVQRTDYSQMPRRQAISCTLCNAHLGHVFGDGPSPTYQRYCMDSLALTFVARAA